MFEELEAKDVVKSTHILITGAYTMVIERSIFSVLTGLIVEILIMLFSIYNGLKMSEYDVYYLMDFH